MTKYSVLVEETLARYVTVEAEDEREAVDIVQKAYEEERIVLDSSCFSEVTIDTEYTQEAREDEEVSLDDNGNKI
jgi:hypothetical protein